MIEGRNIVCFASGWSYHPTSKHHVMRGLAEHNHVVWVNWHSSRRPGLSLDDLKTMAGKLWQIQRGPRQASDNITVTTPPQLPLPSSAWARKTNACLVRRAVRGILKQLPKRPVQLWSFAPDVSDLVGCFGEELALYYCVDAFGEFPGYDRELIARLERKLIDRSDIVLTTSQPLYESKRPLHRNVRLVQHGVDHQHLSRAVTDNPIVPEDLRRLPKPVFGFVGVVGEWVDLDLLAGLARRRPDASIVMIGPTSTPRIAGLPNIHWLGARSHQDLPNYLAGFDVGLIPFRQVPLTHNANPIKLYEYLAAGVPVVSTPLPAVQPMPGSVWLASSADRTAACCSEALRHNQPRDRLRRSRLMAAEAWTARLERISQLVSDVLGSRTRPVPITPTGNPSREALLEPSLT
ncbi:MAG TPA: glycosyltransferase [Phycisphaerae bacterium]|nr:glycosyltransferase [Phycisphaerae bacterium]